MSKSDELYKLVWWRMKQTRGRDMLKSIGTNHDELRRLLGPVYPRAMAAVHGSLPAPTPLPLPAPSVASSDAAPTNPHISSRAAVRAAMARVVSSPVHAFAAQSSAASRRHLPATPSVHARNVSSPYPTPGARTAPAHATTSSRTASIPPGRGVQFIPDGPVAKKAKTSHPYR